MEGEGFARVSSLAKQALGVDAEGAGLPVKRWAVVNPWDAPKDGRQRVSDVRSKWLRK